MSNERDYAYKVGAWSRLAFRGQAAPGGLLEGAMQARREGAWAGHVRETFGRALGLDTTLLAKDALDVDGEWSAELHSRIEALPEWDELAARTMGDTFAAAAAAAEISARMAATLPPLPEEQAGLDAERNDAQQAFDLAHDAGDDTLKNEAGTKLAALAKRQERADAQRKALCAAATPTHSEKAKANQRQALRAALRAAAEKAGDEQDMVVAFGCGKAEGAESRRAIRARLANNPSLAKIAKLAGRMKLAAARKQAEKVTSQSGETTGVTLGGDITALLPSERAMLALGDDTEALLYSKLLEKRAMVYERKQNESRTGGPIVFVVDESASMTGDRNNWAKAFMLGLMEICKRQRRAFSVVHFSTRTHVERFATPEQATTARLLGECERFLGGGTNIAAALDVAAGEVEALATPGGKADVVLLTDACDSEWKGAVTDRIVALRAKGASTYVVAVDSPCIEAVRKVATDTVDMRTGEMRDAEKMFARI